MIYFLLGVLLFNYFISLFYVVNVKKGISAFQIIVLILPYMMTILFLTLIIKWLYQNLKDMCNNLENI